MVRLVPMTEDDFREAMARAIPRHAANSVRRGHWREEAALEACRREIAERHPQGVRTPNQFFAKIVNEDDDTRVGETWYSSEEQGGKIRFWVDWIWIEPEYRRRGFATQVLELLAKEAVQQGADRMGLYVYTDNPGAMSLYTKLGYVTETMGMIRDLKRSL